MHSLISDSVYVIIEFQLHLSIMICIFFKYIETKLQFEKSPVSPKGTNWEDMRGVQKTKQALHMLCWPLWLFVRVHSPYGSLTCHARAYNSYFRESVIKNYCWMKRCLLRFFSPWCWFTCFVFILSPFSYFVIFCFWLRISNKHL